MERVEEYTSEVLIIRNSARVDVTQEIDRIKVKIFGPAKFEIQKGQEGFAKPLAGKAAFFKKLQEIKAKKETPTLLIKRPISSKRFITDYFP